ncbi:hypothetical protein V8C26DRAFT_369365 [Trichoderma gracile]
MSLNLEYPPPACFPTASRSARSRRRLDGERRGFVPSESVCILHSIKKSEHNSYTARWPSWLWRQVKATLTSNSWWSNPRGFESHSRQIFLFAL